MGVVNDGNPVQYNVFITNYMDMITKEMPVKKKPRIMLGMLEKEAETAFSIWHGRSDDPDERLRLIWEDFENLFGHRE